MEYNSAIKKALVGVVILAVVAFVAALIISYINKNNSKDDQSAAEIGTKLDVPKDQLPEALPANLPQEENTTVVDNYTVPLENGREEGARLYVTNKTVDENVTIYNDFLKSDGWSEISNKSFDNLKIITGSKGEERILVNISQTEDGQTSTVSVYVTK